MMQRFRKLWWLVMLCGVAIVCFAAALPSLRPQVAEESSTEVVLDAPLNTASNAPWDGKFVTRHRGGYVLVLAIDRSGDDRDFRIAGCLLGKTWNSSPDCGSTRSMVDLTWRLERIGPSRVADAQPVETEKIAR